MRVSIPRPVQLVIDDVGWREGWRADAPGGPYRAGINRLLGPADYAAIADVGAALGIRPTAAMVLCEWDKTNVCATQPTCTQAGAAWDNRPRAGAWSDETADLFRNRAAHLELAMHGVGHEHWNNGVRTRAEWHTHCKTRWCWSDLQGHLRVFREILDQHGLGPATGHRLPPNFIPCAFAYLWDEADPQDTGALDLRPTADGLECDVEIYGTQPVTIIPGFAPGVAEIARGRLQIVGRREGAADGSLTLQLAGRDIQGERGTVRVHRAG